MRPQHVAIVRCVWWYRVVNVAELRWYQVERMVPTVCGYRMVDCLSRLHCAHSSLGTRARCAKPDHSVPKCKWSPGTVCSECLQCAALPDSSLPVCGAACSLSLLQASPPLSSLQLNHQHPSCIRHSSTALASTTANHVFVSSYRALHRSHTRHPNDDRHCQPRARRGWRS